MIELILSIYTTYLYQPVYNLVILLYDFSPGPNLGWAIVMLAIIVRLLFLPFTFRGYKTDQLLESLTAKVNAIENDPNFSAKEKRQKITALMHENGINTRSEIISLFGQLIFLGILFQIVQDGITPAGYDKLYGFVPPPDGDVNKFFFSFDLSKTSFIISGIAAGLLFIEQLWEYEAKKNIPEATFSERWYPLLLPIFTFILLIILPATKAVFLIASIVFSLGIRLMFTLGRAGKKQDV